MAETNFKLRSSTNNDPYASLVFTAAANYDAGEITKIEDTVGVVVHDTDSGDEGVLVYQAAKILVACVAITSGNLADFAEGCKVYFDAADKEVNESASGNTLCGIVVVQPSVGDETVLIHLMGCLGIVA
jgi:predicted RecA/RadA family phage recombinase